MGLSLDIVALGAPDLDEARAFYTSAFATPPPTGLDRTVRLDLHGTGRIALRTTGTLAEETGTDPATRGFRGCVLNYVVRQPSEVEALVRAAVHAGAKLVKPAKKGFFGGCSAVVQAVDGTIWKLAAPTKKDTGPAGDPPTPTEIVAVLGVAEPKKSKEFYESLGMTVDRNYGSTFVDFRFEPGTCRLGLMPHKGVAKDAGVDPDGDGFRATVLTHHVASRDDVATLLTAAASAGGRVTVTAHGTEHGGDTGHFTDPDGHLWKVTCS